MKDKKDLINMIKNWKIKKDQLLIIFLAGILLLIIAMPGTRQETKTEKSEEEVNRYLPNADSEKEYLSYTENHLERLLSQMEGVGDVTVMITLSESAEKVIEKDVERSSESVSEKDSQGGKRTTKNEKLGETTIYGGENGYSITGSNGQGDSKEPYVSKELTPRVEGVVVVASGGDNAVVRKNITESVQALFGIDTHKIRIVKKQ